MVVYVNSKPTLSVLISAEDDINICNETVADIYFQLPDCLSNECSKYIDIFLRNSKITPWFPSILIGKDFNATVEFLYRVQPKIIVTNNTGIAYEAYKMKIPWIAGPYLNIVNSYSLLCLKENFNCFGAFISNEISKIQIKGIKNPENFKLYYSIYHPIMLMTSRQCLFHQVLGCEKDKMDDTCLPQCDKYASIANGKKDTLIIEKAKGHYHTIYSATNYLNTDIVADIPNFFSSFFIDIRNIKTSTKTEVDKVALIRLFENLLNGNSELSHELKRAIYPTTNEQYRKGI